MTYLGTADSATAELRLNGTKSIVNVGKALKPPYVADILAITDGGPGDSTWVASWYIYSSAFRYMKLGVGSAGGYLLSLALGLLAFLYMRTLHRPVEY